MHHILALLASLMLLAPLARGADTVTPEEAIGHTLDALHAAAAAADGERYFALFAPDAVFIGTDAAERWTLEQFRDYASPLFARGSGWVYRPRERHITLAGLPCACIAWFDELLDSQSYGTSRGTGVLVRDDDGAWKIAQYALTFPMPNDLATELTGRIRGFEGVDAQRQDQAPGGASVNP